MNESIESLMQGHHFDEFQYQLVYLRPSAYSDERIAVGLIANSNDRVEARFVSAGAAIELMERMLGDHGVEQFQFATAEFRRGILNAREISQVNIPTDLLITGETLTAYTKDRDGLLGSILSSSSLLLRAGASKVVERLGCVNNTRFSQDLFDHVSRLDPFLGDQIFFHRLPMENGEIVELPILGKNVFGAPISFAIRDHRLLAEAYVAKFNWVRKKLPKQRPKVYVLSPAQTDLDTSGRLEKSIKELRAIAGASQVAMQLADSTEELASAIVHDESKSPQTRRRVRSRKVGT